jgi:hypothetical protein
MDDAFYNIEFIYQDDTRNSDLFQINSSACAIDDSFKPKPSSLNLELLGTFRRTPLVVLVNLFVEKAIGHNSNSAYVFACRAVAFVLLSVADPTFFVTSKRLNIFKGEPFANIEPLFKVDGFGRKYLPFDGATRINDQSTSGLNERLCGEKLLVKEEDGFYVNDEFVLIGLKIKG